MKSRWSALLVALALCAVRAPASTYTNPLLLNDPKTGPAVSCPDPAITKERIRGADHWYLFCTGDPLNSNDKDANGNLKNHYIAEYQSLDLIHWTYIGDVLPALPAWMGAVTTNLWAPAVKHFNGQYYVYYVAPTTAAGGSAIGVATSKHAAGPWTDSGNPVIAPEPNPYNNSFLRAVIDPDEIQDDSGQRWISYGSFNGGISIRKLSADGLTSDPTSEQQVAIDNTYEGANFWKHDGYYYLFVSTSSCCDGPLSGYSVTVGRAQTPTGPFLDQDGVPLLTFAPGGSIAIAANGNKWVGPGGNVVFTDDAGQDYMLYHAIDQLNPYFDGYPGFTRRPALLDPIEWVNGWPEVRGGFWASATPQPAPAAQPWEWNAYTPVFKPYDEPGAEITSLSDEFNSSTLSPQWHFLHPNANNSYALTGTAYQAMTQGPDENSDPQHVSILAEPAPVNGDYLVETRISSSVPFDNSCCYNFAQGALFIYGNDGNSIKLDVFPDFDVRLTEFGKQISPVPQNYPTYDHMTIGPAGFWTWLRIVKRTGNDGLELYTAYTSNDGQHWTRGGTWQHNLGSGAQIGIAAENTAGYTIDFDYVRVYRLSK
ncbi:MAG TPA: family 43 glycosylhydrolase [Bryobacteraceae bacterium]|nr:family 43 glycosylhydrolase [Bryobacteraceae bacterium]